MLLVERNMLVDVAHHAPELLILKPPEFLSRPGFDFVVMHSRMPPASCSYGVMASTRRGLPEPLTILSGAAITIAPVGGSRSRLMRLVMPNFPAPCIKVWLGN